jgi:hypothetical protein
MNPSNLGLRAAVMLQDGSVYVGILRMVNVAHVEVPSPMPGRSDFIDGPSTMEIIDAIRIVPAYDPSPVPYVIRSSETGIDGFAVADALMGYARTAGDTPAGEIP